MAFVVERASNLFKPSISLMKVTANPLLAPDFVLQHHRKIRFHKDSGVLAAERVRSTLMRRTCGHAARPM